MKCNLTCASLKKINWTFQYYSGFYANSVNLSTNHSKGCYNNKVQQFLYPSRFIFKVGLKQFLK